jgi:hypothetical protein
VVDVVEVGLALEGAQQPVDVLGGLAGGAATGVGPGAEFDLLLPRDLVDLERAPVGGRDVLAAQ